MDVLEGIKKVLTLSTRILDEQRINVAERHALQLKHQLRGYSDESKIHAINGALDNLERRNTEHARLMLVGLKRVFPELKERIGPGR